VAKYQVDVLRLQPLTSAAALALGINQPEVGDLGPLAEPPRNMLAIANQPLAQAGELLSVGAQPHRVQANARLLRRLERGKQGHSCLLLD